MYELGLIAAESCDTLLGRLVTLCHAVLEFDR